jgi:hypothetical protein
MNKMSGALVTISPLSRQDPAHSEDIVGENSGAIDLAVAVGIFSRIRRAGFPAGGSSETNCSISAT